MRKCNICGKEYATDHRFIMHLGADHSVAPITFIMTPHYIECFDENSTEEVDCS